MKYIILAIFIGFTATMNAQSLEGKLTLNGKSETEIKLENNSAVSLFKNFKTGKYKLSFQYNGKELPTNIYKEQIIFFEFRTTIKKDGELVKNVIRKQPMPYFPGDMGLPAEAFDFIGPLAVTSTGSVDKNNRYTGIMASGKYTVELSVRPVNGKGEVQSVRFHFYVKNV